MLLKLSPINSNQPTTCKEVCKDTIIYDPETNSWENIGKLNEARACFGCGKELDTIYVVGGVGLNGSFLTSIECLPEEQQPIVWTVCRQTLPVGIADAHVSVCFLSFFIYVKDSYHKKYFRNCLLKPIDVQWKEEVHAVPDQGILVPHYQVTNKLEAFAKLLNSN